MLPESTHLLAQFIPLKLQLCPQICDKKSAKSPKKEKHLQDMKSEINIQNM